MGVIKQKREYDGNRCRTNHCGRGHRRNIRSDCKSDHEKATDIRTRRRCRPLYIKSIFYSTVLICEKGGLMSQRKLSCKDLDTLKRA